MFAGDSHMAQFSPFRGILYNPQRVGDLADVVTPPYDVITDAERLVYHNRHSHNIIRLILGNVAETDTIHEGWHIRASRYFRTWLSEGILLRDTRPSLYLTALDFGSDAGMISRYGVIGLTALEPFEKGIILPHEKTFSKVRSERLSLMKTCHTNFSPIFALYSDDHTGILDTLKAECADQSPDVDFTDRQGQRHRLWRVTDPRVHGFVSNAMQAKRIFIADGHHRYETALNYRQWMMEQLPGIPRDHPANYVMMYLSSMDDPGLIIRPAHRMMNGVNPTALCSFVEESRPFFDITSFPAHGNPTGGALSAFLETLRSSADSHGIGVCIRGRSDYLLLRLRPGVMGRRYGNTVPGTLQDLDVMVLTRLILMDILGFDQERLDNEKLIRYSSREEEALDAVRAGRSDIAFILNPTRIEQVRRIAEAGLIMPRKATYFYPKVITGLVMNVLSHAVRFDPSAAT